MNKEKSTKIKQKGNENFIRKSVFRIVSQLSQICRVSYPQLCF